MLGVEMVFYAPAMCANNNVCGLCVSATVREREREREDGGRFGCAAQGVFTVCVKDVNQNHLQR